MSEGFDPTPFDNAAIAAQQKLEQMVAAMTPEQREGFEKTKAWFKNNYMNAGLKRAGKVLMGTFRPGERGGG